MGKLLGLALAAGGAWWLGEKLGWFGGSAPLVSPPAPGTSPANPANTPPVNPANPPNAPINNPAATWSIAGPVSPNINNSLSANVLINGTSKNLTIMQDSSIWDTSGSNITSQIQAMGIDPNALLLAFQTAFAAAGGASVNPGRIPTVQNRFGGCRA